MKFLKVAMLAAIMAVCSSVALSDSFIQKNGLEVRVSQKTVQTFSLISGAASTKNEAKLVTLVLKIKNISFKELPAGQITYSIIRESKSSTDVTFQIISGIETLQSLTPAQEITTTLGVAKVDSSSSRGKITYYSKLHYKIVVKHGGQETAQIVSTQKFDNLAALAKAPRNSEDLKLGSPGTQSASPVIAELPRAAQKPAAPERLQSTPAAADATEPKVWVNTKSGIYYKPGGRYYGKTAKGEYMTEAEAIKAGYRPPQH